MDVHSISHYFGDDIDDENDEGLCFCSLADLGCMVQHRGGSRYSSLLSVSFYH